MDANRKNNQVHHQYFAKLHEKVMNKYDEMQKKLNKSKSLDCLLSSKDSVLYKDDCYIQNDKVDSSKDEIYYKAETTQVKHSFSMSVEDVVQYHAKSDDVQSEQEKTHHEEFEESDFDFEFSDEIFSTVRKGKSIESLAEENEDHIQQTLPTPERARKMSIREKIENRISVAKEKRQESKEKKRDSMRGVDKLILSSTILNDIPLKKRNKTATVIVALIKATGLATESIINDKLRMLSCRMRLGAEKRKSKTVKSNAADVSWQELFNFDMYDESLLEIILLDKDLQIGRTTVDLTEVTKEKTHKMNLQLNDKDTGMQLFILLTITGTMANTFTETENHKESQEKLHTLRRTFAWYKIQDMSDIGWLSVTVYGAKGLASSETYCVLELGNERLQTHTYYKSHDPLWIKTISFAVTDATSILEVSVWDEKKYEIIGRISVRLLQITNSKKTWYALKDVTLRDRAKGNNPRILLEINFTWNLIKASLRVVKPKEAKCMGTEIKFDRHIFLRNWTRARAVLSWVLHTFKIMKICFEWESRDWNLIALVIWLLFWWCYKSWMAPLLLLLPFAWYKPPDYLFGNWKKIKTTESTVEDTSDKEEKNSSLIQKIHSLQEIIQTIQGTVGQFATLGESVKNLYNFTEPFLSFLAIFFIVVISLVMFVVPVNYLLMFWGCYKFLRKILWPHRIPNNELMDLLSRVPDDDTLLDCKELPLLEMSEEDNSLIFQ